jgi:hypothetical protein
VRDVVAAFGLAMMQLAADERGLVVRTTFELR